MPSPSDAATPPQREPQEDPDAPPTPETIRRLRALSDDLGEYLEDARSEAQARRYLRVLDDYRTLRGAAR